MNRKIFLAAGSLLAAVVCGATGAAAGATTLVTVVSNEHTSICINPTEKGLEGTVKGKTNFKGLGKSHKGPFPDTGAACDPPEGAPTEFAIPMTGPGGPGNPAGPYTGTIPGASWVSYNAGGFDNTTLPVNPPPKYYIYDAEFFLECTGVKKPPKTLSTVASLYADNAGSAFLNGGKIGSQATGGSLSNRFDGPPSGGWPFTLGGGKHLQLGVNVLQFKVLDESQPNTGIDFRVEVQDSSEKSVCSAHVII